MGCRSGLFGVFAIDHQLWGEELTVIAPSVPGGLIAFYQVGYGIAAFSIGPLQQQANLSLNTLFGATMIFALALSALSLVIARDEQISASGFGVRTSSNMIDRQIEGAKYHESRDVCGEESHEIEKHPRVHGTFL